ncbi:MAG: hypothetical protein U9M95_06370 [Candidatus Altiarchaeota archaeon]|nr:hypothetical protein [Candidatus Altiarchaeota archaeon]
MDSNKIILPVFFVLVFSATAYSESLEKEWSINVKGTIHDLIVADVDGDNIPEIVFFFKNNNIHGNDFLYTVDNEGGERWHLNLEGIESVYVSDLGTQDPSTRIFVSYGKSSEGIEKGRLLILEGGGRVVLKYPIPTLGFTPVMYKMESVDIDRNGYNELIGGTRKGVYAINDRFIGELWTSMIGQPIRDFILEDIDCDGITDVISESLGVIYNTNIKNGSISWKIATGDYIKSGDNQTTVEKDKVVEILKVGDVSPHPHKEIIAVTSIGVFFIYNSEGCLISVGGDSNAIRKYVENYSNYTIHEAISGYGKITALSLYDFNENSLQEFILGTTSGLYIWDILSGEQQFINIGEVKAIQESPDGKIFILTENAIHELGVNQEIIETYSLDESYQRIHIADVDGIGGLEFILIKDGDMSVYSKKETPTTTLATTTSSTMTTTTSATTTQETPTTTLATTTTQRIPTTTLATTTTTESEHKGDIDASDVLLALIAIVLILVIARYCVENLKKRGDKEKISGKDEGKKKRDMPTEEEKKSGKDEGGKKVDMPTEEDLKALEEEIEKRKKEYTIKEERKTELSDKERELEKEWEKSGDIVEVDEVKKSKNSKE